MNSVPQRKLFVQNKVVKFSFSRAKSNVSRQPMKFDISFLWRASCESNELYPEMVSFSWILNQSFAMSHWLLVDTRTKRILNNSNNKPGLKRYLSKRLFWWAYVKRGGAYYRRKFCALKWVWLHNKNSLKYKNANPNSSWGIHSEGFNIISEGYLRLRVFFFLGGGMGEGGGLLLGGLIFEEGVGLIILRYSPVRTFVRSC